MTDHHCWDRDGLTRLRQDLAQIWGECEPRCEIHFSILQRKVLTPAVAASLAALAVRILDFKPTMQWRPKTIDWQFTSTDFDKRLAEIAEL